MACPIDIENWITSFKNTQLTFNHEELKYHFTNVLNHTESIINKIVIETVNENTWMTNVTIYCEQNNRNEILWHGQSIHLNSVSYIVSACLTSLYKVWQHIHSLQQTSFFSPRYLQTQCHMYWYHYQLQCRRVVIAFVERL